MPGTGRVLQTYAYDSEDLSLPLHLTATAQRSRLLGQAFPTQLKRWITEENLTTNLHHDGVAPEDRLSSWDILSYSMTQYDMSIR